MNRRLLFIALMLFFASLLVRVGHGIRYITFGQDQARDAFLMNGLQQNRTFLVGYGPKASVGNFYLPPLYYQIHNILSRLSNQNPLIMMWFILIVESFTPVILFLWLRLIVRERAALLGALLYTISAGVIMYATFAWNPNMIPFFSTLFGLSCFLAVFSHRRWVLPVIPLTLAVAISLHFESVVLLPFAVLTALITLKQDIKNIRYWILGGLLASLLFVPYIGAELKTNWHNTRAMLEFFQENNTRYFDRISKPAYVLSFFPGLIERFLFLRNFPQLLFGRVLFFGGFLVATLVLLTQKSRPKLLILLYFLSIFIMLRVYKGDKVDYYMSTLYVLPGFLFAFLSEKFNKIVIPFALLIAFGSGVMAFKNPPHNGLESIRTASSDIAHMVGKGPVRLLFQNQEYVNLLAFGLSSQGIAIDQRSTTVIDVCNTNDPCAWNGRPECVPPVSHTLSVLEKNASDYQMIYHHAYPGAFQLVMGSEQNTAIRNIFPFYQQITDDGTDTLLPQLYVQD